MRHPGPPALISMVLLGLLAGCAGSGSPEDRADGTELPRVGECRMLTADDVARPSNTSPTVECDDSHTAETFLVGELPSTLTDATYDAPALGRFAYQTCAPAFAEHLGADESAVMRTVLSWAWFRPPEAAWEDGSRWFRCDLVGGGPQSAEYVELPERTEGLLLRPSDEWLVCAMGPTVSGSVKVPCSEPHDWRAVTTIKLGEPEDDYPGDRVVEVRTRDFCSESVGAVLGYPNDYDFGYTWFHEAEWKVGNRRSVCWAKTDQ